MCIGMQEWLAEKYEAGIEAGRKIGMDQGEDKLSRLVQKLAAENGMDEILLAAEDKDYRNRLYKKYDLL